MSEFAHSNGTVELEHGECMTEANFTSYNKTHVTLFKDKAYPQLMIPARNLTYGIYWFRLNISMYGQKGIEGNDTVYIEIGELPSLNNKMRLVAAVMQLR